MGALREISAGEPFVLSPGPGAPDNLRTSGLQHIEIYGNVFLHEKKCDITDNLGVGAETLPFWLDPKFVTSALHLESVA